MLLAKRDPQELPEPRHDVVLEPVAIHDRDHVVLVGYERRVRNLREVVLEGVALVREDQPRLIEAVTTEHTADGVRDKGADVITHCSVIVGVSGVGTSGLSVVFDAQRSVNDLIDLTLDQL